MSVRTILAFTCAYQRLAEDSENLWILKLLKSFLLLLQVKSNFRSSITIPEKSWARFRDIFNDYVEKMSEVTGDKGSSGGGGGSGASGSQSGEGGNGTGGSSTGGGGAAGGTSTKWRQLID